MSFFTIKTLLALVFLSSGFTALITMLTLMGKPDKKMSPKTLKIIHKTGGYLFLILLFVLVFLGTKYWASAGDLISTRAVFHIVLGLTLFVVLFIKLSIVRFFKQFMKFLPVMGITLFSLTFILVSVTGGFHILRSSVSPVLEIQGEIPKAEGTDISNGRQIFQNNCIFCHHIDKEEKKAGPGLKDLLKKDKLPSSGRAASLENVKSQILDPLSAMPPFNNFSQKEMGDLLAFLETL